MRPGTLIALSILTLAGCSGTDDDDAPPMGWRVIYEDLPSALLSVWGTSVNDVWAVGGDARDGTGPIVVHYDGSTWTRVLTGATSGDLWWVFGFKGGPVLMGGSGGRILRYEGGAFTTLNAPSSATVFGIWGATADDLWAVGGEVGARGGFAWRNDGGDTWTPEPTLPPESVTTAAVWKGFGRSADDVWLVGSGTVAFHWDGQALTPGMTGVGSSLFTVHEHGGRFAAVGGLASGVIVENDGTGWANVTPTSAIYGLTGVVLGAGDTGYAVGQFGSLFVRSAAGWTEEVQELTPQNLHGVWLDDAGGVWTVGGQTNGFPLTDGVMLYKGPTAIPNGAK